MIGKEYDEIYDEIDQIYDYVRGFAPLPKNLNNFEFTSDSSSPNLHNKISSQNNSQKLDGGRDTNKLNDTTKSFTNNNKLEKELLNSNGWIKHELMEKPIPPPLKTIPSKKNLNQRRPTLIFGKSNCSTHYPKVSSPLIQKDIMSPFEPQSPLFHIR